MLPFTKAVPKEMLPIGNKPLIQYAVEEAAASGIEEIILVTRGDKPALERHFATDPTLEEILGRQGRKQELDAVRSLSKLAKITSVRQDSPRGLGDALLCARPFVDGQPFAVILPDAIISAAQPALSQLIAAYSRRPASYVATQSVEPEDVVRFGMLAVDMKEDSASPGVLRVRGVVEKPTQGDAPSHYGVFGRYLFEPEIFDFLDCVANPGREEARLSDALTLLCRQRVLYALCFDGKHYDAGNKLGYLQAVVDFALEAAETRSAVQSILTKQCASIAPEPHDADYRASVPERDLLERAR